MHAPDSVAFSIFGLDIKWYGILIGAGFLLATLISYKRARSHGVDPDLVLDLVIFMIPTAIIGARAYYVLFNLDVYAGDWAAIFDIRNGGLAIHGGLIACLIVAFFVCRHHGASFLRVADLIAPTIPLAQAIGRWGNFFNEEAHGGPTDLPWAQIIDGVGYHPTFLYESIWCFLLFWLLLYLDKHHHSFDGQILLLYGILYSVERFFVEGLRTDSLMLGPFRQAQLMSVAIIAFCGLCYLFLWRRSKRSRAGCAADANASKVASDDAEAAAAAAEDAVADGAEAVPDAEEAVAGDAKSAAADAGAICADDVEMTGADAPESLTDSETAETVASAAPVRDVTEAATAAVATATDAGTAAEAADSEETAVAAIPTDVADVAEATASAAKVAVVAAGDAKSAAAAAACADDVEMTGVDTAETLTDSETTETVASAAPVRDVTEAAAAPTGADAADCRRGDAR